jgi:hypothetical protein
MLVEAGDTVVIHGEPVEVISTEVYHGALIVQIEVSDWFRPRGVGALLEAEPPQAPVIGWRDDAHIGLDQVEINGDTFAVLMYCADESELARASDEDLVEAVKACVDRLHGSAMGLGA